MSTIEDRPTTGERYANATESSNLRVIADRRGDADVLIAAGWCSDTLGASLARLKTEFDTVRAEIRSTTNATVTERALVLMQLKTLRGTREVLGALARGRATRTGFDRPVDEINKLAGRVLDVFLDPLCGKCDGRGFNGAGRHEQSGPQIKCGTCKATGRRKSRLGADEAETAFAHALLADIEEKASRFDQQLAKRLRSDF